MKVIPTDNAFHNTRTKDAWVNPKKTLTLTFNFLFYVVFFHKTLQKIPVSGPNYARLHPR